MLDGAVSGLGLPLSELVSNRVDCSWEVVLKDTGCRPDDIRSADVLGEMIGAQDVAAGITFELTLAENVAVGAFEVTAVIGVGIIEMGDGGGGACAALAAAVAAALLQGL
jgi:hypothetical protein